MLRKVFRRAVSARARWWKATAAVSLLALVLGSATGGAGGRMPQNAAPATRSGHERAANSAVTGESATAAATGAATFGPNVGAGVYDGESPAVSDLPVLPIPPATSITARDNENLQAASPATSANDPVVQKVKGTGPISAPIANFDGICLPFGPPCDQASSCSCLPPDTNGEAGLTQYVEMVNSNFAVYSKTGTVLRPSTAINRLWAGTNSECATHNDGDPVLVYDQLANRWLLSQFIATPQTGEPYGVCVAISKTSDTTGAYYRYTFLFGGGAPQTFFDYPKFGVWPDGYYMSANAFPASQATSSGAGAFVLERSKMLNGTAGALRLLRRVAAPPARRPVHRPAARRSRRFDAATRRPAGPVRGGRRSELDPRHLARPGLRPESARTSPSCSTTPSSPTDGTESAGTRCGSRRAGIPRSTSRGRTRRPTR